MSRAAAMTPLTSRTQPPPEPAPAPGLRLSRAHARTDPLPAGRWSAATLTDRVRALCAGRTPQAIARLSGVSVDSVRRYLRGAGIPPRFLVALSQALEVSLNWLLTGRGPVRRAEVIALALERASTTDLLGELAARIRDAGLSTRATAARVPTGA
jgi:transcriptional regulator with XRE-family HTH domain